MQTRDIIEYQTPIKFIKSARRENMTDSMIPYSFIPGTKAKANEVNANFISLANFIEQNKNSTASDIETINNILKEKADKTELINEHTVTQSNTDLNNYKTKGTYIFSTLYKPLNIPKGESGMLLVTGDENSVIKQIWYCNGENPEVFTRDFENKEWGEWYSHNGILSQKSNGYLKLANGMLIQWGYRSGANVTYPLAFKEMVCTVFSKQGYTGATTADAGSKTQTLTGCTFGCGGGFSFLHWIAIG